MGSDRKQALVYHAGAVGDFITILPAISLWRKHNPNAHLYFLGKAATGRLGCKAGYFDELLDIDRASYAALFGENVPISLKAFLQKLDTAILFSIAGAPLVSAFKTAGVLNIYQQNPRPAERRHVVAYHLDLFQKRYGRINPAYPMIEVPKKGLPKTGQPVVVLHHGSGSQRKNWPPERFSQMAKRLRKRDCTINWIQGPADQAPPANRDDLVFKSDDLWACAKQMAAASLFVGNDSGLTHLAAAVGCNTVALFGASDPIVWRPLGPKVKVITSAADCPPCHQGSQTKKDCQIECMAAITVDQVYNTCLKQISEFSNDH